MIKARGSKQGDSLIPIPPLLSRNPPALTFQEFHLLVDQDLVNLKPGDAEKTGF